MLFVIKRFLVFLSYFWWRLSERNHIEHGFVQSKKSCIYYQRTGSGRSLILLHGGYVQLEAFAAQIPFFSKHFSVIAIDTRGHGRSTHGVRALTYASFADDVIAVLEHLGVTKAYFMGWSDGANTCIELALRFPTFVEKMVLISANYHVDGLRQKSDGWVAQFFSRSILSSLYAYFSPHPSKWKKLDSQLKKLWQSEPNHTQDGLASIGALTLIVGGESDYILESHFKEMAAAIPSARLHIVPKAKHDPHITHSKQMNELMMAFLTNPTTRQNNGSSIEK